MTKSNNPFRMKGSYSFAIFLLLIFLSTYFIAGYSVKIAGDAANSQLAACNNACITNYGSVQVNLDSCKEQCKTMTDAAVTSIAEIELFEFFTDLTTTQVVLYSIALAVIGFIIGWLIALGSRAVFGE